MKNKWLLFYLVLLGTALVVGSTACGVRPEEAKSAEDGKLNLVATTTFIGDVVYQVAGDNVHLTVLLEPGQNPHAYRPAPQDMVKISEADLIFANGLGLEEFLDDLLAGADPEGELVIVSEGIKTLQIENHDHAADENKQDHSNQDDDHEDEGEGNDQSGSDPHVWLDPNNVMIWTDNIARALTDKDPARSAVYQANAEAYREELRELDSWIRKQVERIPPDNRKLVTDHESFRYFLERYGFQNMGAVIPALTTEAETSGQELADLINTIQKTDVKAIFVGIDIDPTLSQRVSEEAGVELIPLYFGSLSAGDPAGTYLSFMRYDVDAIVMGLK